MQEISTVGRMAEIAAFCRLLFENGEKVAAMTAIYEQQNGLLSSRAEDRLAHLQEAIKEAGQSLQSRASSSASSPKPKELPHELEKLTCPPSREN